MLQNTLLQAGDELDHYSLLREVDRAPLATIFEAVDRDTGARVMLRVPDPGAVIDPAFAARLRREEEIYHELNHPGLIKIIADESRSRPYVVTEWFEGLTLRKIIDEGRMAAERAMAIALHIADAVGYLHAHGIVVRDLSPNHILVNEDNAIKLTEFEAASKAGALRLTFANLTQLIRSTAYTAPEELAGERGEARVDVYALGVILYEMLTGRIPWDTAPLPERRARKPIPPRQLERSISPALESVILKALQPEARDRYPGMVEMIFDLTHLDQVAPSAAKSTRKLNRALLYVAALLVPLVLFGLLLLMARLR